MMFFQLSSIGALTFAALLTVQSVIATELEEPTNPGPGPHCSVDQSPGKPSLVTRPVPRVGNITIAEFRVFHSRPDMAVPLLFENIMTDVFDPSDWTREKILKECGHVPLLMPYGIHNGDEEKCLHPHGNSTWGCHKVHFANKDLLGKQWAGMDAADLNEHKIHTLRDLLETQDTPEGEHLILLDAPLSHYCPPARERLRIPKYFARDYNRMTYKPSDAPQPGQTNFHPALFIAKKGTGTPLHGDSRMERFYFQQLAGRKLWRLFGPSEYSKLYPEYTENEDGTVWFKSEGYYPVHFHVDAMNPDFEKFPELDGALMYEAILNPGDVMFVPAGWAHQVVNLDDTIATGLNFVDAHGLQQQAEYQKFRLGEYKYHNRKAELNEAYFFPLDPIWPKESPEESTISFSEYFHHIHLPNEETVPSVVVDFVNSRSTRKLNAWRSPQGYSALTLAARYNFLAVVKYLIEEGGVDVNGLDADGDSALYHARAYEFHDLEEYLVSQGAAD